MWLRHLSGKVGFWMGEAGSHFAETTPLCVLVPVGEASWTMETWVMKDTECLIDAELRDPSWTR